MRKIEIIPQLLHQLQQQSEEIALLKNTYLFLKKNYQATNILKTAATVRRLHPKTLSCETDLEFAGKERKKNGEDRQAMRELG
jgi:hypothetical protein